MSSRNYSLQKWHRYRTPLVSSSSVSLKWSRQELHSLCEPFLFSAYEMEKTEMRTLSKEQQRRPFNFVCLIYDHMVLASNISSTSASASSPRLASASSPSSPTSSATSASFTFVPASKSELASSMHGILCFVQQHHFELSSSFGVSALCRAYVMARQSLGRDHSISRVFLEAANIVTACSKEGITMVHYALVSDYLPQLTLPTASSNPVLSFSSKKSQMKSLPTTPQSTQSGPLPTMCWAAPSRSQVQEIRNRVGDLEYVREHPILLAQFDHENAVSTSKRWYTCQLATAVVVLLAVNAALVFSRQLNVVTQIPASVKSDSSMSALDPSKWIAIHADELPREMDDDEADTVDAESADLSASTPAPLQPKTFRAYLLNPWRAFVPTQLQSYLFPPTSESDFSWHFSAKSAIRVQNAAVFDALKILGWTTASALAGLIAYTIYDVQQVHRLVEEQQRQQYSSFTSDGLNDEHDSMSVPRHASPLSSPLKQDAVIND